MKEPDSYVTVEQNTTGSKDCSSSNVLSEQTEGGTLKMATRRSQGAHPRRDVLLLCPQQLVSGDMEEHGRDPPWC